MDTFKEKGREFTPEELIIWYKPETWFRKNLVQRTREEITPTIEMRLELVREETMIAYLDHHRGILNDQNYGERIVSLRKTLGNLIYK